MELTKDQLLKLFEYKDGQLLHKLRTPDMFNNGASWVNQWNSRCAGKPAGTNCKTHGYIKVVFKDPWSGDRISAGAHRLIWEMVYGAIPSGMQIDHKNGDRSDNRIENLRVVSVIENARNRGVSKSNTSGTVGVCWNKSRNKWQAVIGGKFVGYFDDKETAALARQAAGVMMGYHENHGKREAHVAKH